MVIENYQVKLIKGYEAGEALARFHDAKCMSRPFGVPHPGVAETGD
jgi:hypothetical protein